MEAYFLTSLPEQVFGSRPYDGRSADIFSIGAVIHHMVVAWQQAPDSQQLLFACVYDASCCEVSHPCTGLQNYVFRRCSSVNFYCHMFLFVVSTIYLSISISIANDSNHLSLSLSLSMYLSICLCLSLYLYIYIARPPPCTY